MTIAAVVLQAGPFSGNGVTTAFPFAFKCFSKAELVWTWRSAAGLEAPLVLDLDYSVALNIDQNATPGGTVTFPLGGSAYAILAAGQKLVGVSNAPETQLTALVAAGGWFPQVVEDALDRMVLLTQQLSQLLSRTLTYPVTDTVVGATLPTSTTRANMFLAFDASGNPIAANAVTGAPASVAMQPVIAAATLALGRAALGLNTQNLWCGTATGTANALTLTPSFAASALLAGLMLTFKASAASNSGATTINVSGLGVIAVQNNGAACVGGEIVASSWYMVVYDGAAFQLANIGQGVFVDTIFTLLGSADLTKQLGFEVDTNVPTGTKVTLTAPKASGVVATTIDLSGAPVIPYFIEGFQIVNNGAASMDVQTGVCADGNNTHMLTNGGTITKTQGAWAAGTGNGGKMSAAAMANNTWYYFYALRKDTDGTVDIGFDVSPTAPTAQAGYAAANYRYIGARKSQLAATNWDTFNQHGEEVLWNTPPALDIVATPTFAARTLTAMNIPAVRVKWFGKASLSMPAGQANSALFTDPACADVASSAGLGLNVPDILISNTTPTVLIVSAEVQSWSNTASQVGARAQNGNGTLNVQTIGWRDPRGKPV